MSFLAPRPRLRPARAADAPALAGVLAGWIAETPWMPALHSADEDLRFLRRLIDEAEVTVAAGWRVPVGFMARDGEVIHALYLAPRVRGRGLGARLLGLAKAQSPRLTLWAFQANERARAFYAREGFREVEFTDGAGNDEKLPDVRLEWRREG